ncbi:DUF559 domain-containing protein [Paenibacillus radicis (ex Gao et al. 2016)]|uniref:DUF559 domain-containing protein n=1 Tax=Paenibacillus radicis (ex Gao et al. 2016) TaxID=1737354 RepID=A0A917HEB0_9BACL|nr:DUF559 domain-containing protein [Paenibacillus radicis (ex Gao et al. 2016)]GGG75704.1 hypothetical protein GCM10010918_35060 [Paenibacillus radicis (ex Gao et al. 2016)]
MQQQMDNFIEAFNREAAINGKFRNKLGKIELQFLEQVWGPAFGYNYEGLKAEHPFLDYKGGQRFADFIFVKHGVKLIMEIDGFTTHARDISPGEFNDHLLRQNDLVLSGWLVLRFSAWQVENQPKQCERQIKQAIGQWWSQAYREDEGHSKQVWESRKQLVLQMAMRKDGKIKASDIAGQFKISNRSATNWLKRFEFDGAIIPVPSPYRVTLYRLPNYIK